MVEYGLSLASGDKRKALFGCGGCLSLAVCARVGALSSAVPCDSRHQPDLARVQSGSELTANDSVNVSTSFPSSLESSIVLLSRRLCRMGLPVAVVLGPAFSLCRPLLFGRCSLSGLVSLSSSDGAGERLISWRISLSTFSRECSRDSLVCVGSSVMGFQT